MPGWMKHKLESRLLEEIAYNLIYADDTTLTAESKEELKNLLMKVKEDSEKADLQLSNVILYGIICHTNLIILRMKWGIINNDGRKTT